MPRHIPSQDSQSARRYLVHRPHPPRKAVELYPTRDEAKAALEEVRRDEPELARSHFESFEPSDAKPLFQALGRSITQLKGSA
jgi:hypothetical protein